MKRGLLVLFAFGLAGCRSGVPAGHDTSSPSPLIGGLPVAVADTRDAIVRAAKALDYAALADLLDPSTFSYSFGDRDDPTGYWRQQEEDAHVPVLGEILPTVLGESFGKDGDTYVWPRASATAPSRWTDADRESLRSFYTDEDISRFVSFDSYTGWRTGIRDDGTWLYFVSGD